MILVIVGYQNTGDMSSYFSSTSFQELLSVQGQLAAERSRCFKFEVSFRAFTLIWTLQRQVLRFFVTSICFHVNNTRRK